MKYGAVSMGSIMSNTRIVGLGLGLGLERGVCRRTGTGGRYLSTGTSLPTLRSSLPKPSSLQFQKSSALPMSTLPLPTDKAGARLAQSDDVRILKSLKQYIWPRKENDVDGIRTRVTASLFLLAAGKVLTVSVPFFFKMVVDSLNDSAALSISATNLDVFQVAGM